MSIEMVLEEMRGTFEAAKMDSDSIYALAIAGDARRWADTIEAAMREPVAYRVTGPNEQYIASSSPPIQSGRVVEPLFALPPDAAGEIEDTHRGTNINLRLQLAEKDAEIERLKTLWYADADPEETAYAEDFYSRVDERDHAAIAKAALAGKEVKP